MTKQDKSFAHLGPAGFHKVAYRQWGDASNPKVLICVHGVSRNSRDFDDVAMALSDRYRVLCPDMPGRGASDWFEDKTHYTQAVYVSVCAALIAHCGAKRVDWLGTSMGGRLGMHLAAQANTPINKLVINDIGPHVPQAGREDNFANFGTDPSFATQDEGIKYVREIRAAFGPTSEAAWDKFCRDSLRQRENGTWTLHYDPGLSVLAKTVRSDDTWDEWEKISCPTYLLWGLKSKLLVADTVARMQSTGPQATVFEVPYAGHCPRLENDEQIGAVRAFLEAQ